MLAMLHRVPSRSDSSLSASDHVSLGIELRAPQIKPRRRRPPDTEKLVLGPARQGRKLIRIYNGKEEMSVQINVSGSLLARSGRQSLPSPCCCPLPPSLLVHELFYGYLHTRSPTTTMSDGGRVVLMARFAVDGHCHSVLVLFVASSASERGGMRRRRASRSLCLSLTQKNSRNRTATWRPSSVGQSAPFLVAFPFLLR